MVDPALEIDPRDIKLGSGLGRVVAKTGAHKGADFEATLSENHGYPVHGQFRVSLMECLWLGSAPGKRQSRDLFIGWNARQRSERLVVYIHADTNAGPAVVTGLC